MSEKQLKFTLESDRQYIGIFDEGYALTGFEVCNLLNSLYQQCEALQNENEQLKAKVKRLQDIATRTEEEKEHYADIYNECRRLKLSDEAIKQAYADLNRREREKHSQGNATYTGKINRTEVIY